MDPRKFVSERSMSVDASGIRKVFDLAAGLKDPINFSIGQPDFDVPEPIKEAAIAAIREGFNSYTPTQGIQPLRDAIGNELAEEFDGWASTVIITSGVSGALMLAMMATLNPGDEVIFVEPYFVMYKHLARLVGAVPVPVDNYPDFRFPADKVAKAVTPKTKMLIVNSPSNPTGMVYTHEEPPGRRRHRRAPRPAAGLRRDLRGPELRRHLPQRRALRPEADAAAAGLQQDLRDARLADGLCGRAGCDPPGDGQAAAVHVRVRPSFAQKACLTALETDVSSLIDAYRRKRDIAYETLRGTFEVNKPSGGFYIFPKVPERFGSATKFVEQAIARNVLVIPGNVFSERDTHFRISYAADDEKIRLGCRILCEVAKG